MILYIYMVMMNMKKLIKIQSEKMDKCNESRNKFISLPNKRSPIDLKWIFKMSIKKKENKIIQYKITNNRNKLFFYNKLLKNTIFPCYSLLFIIIVIIIIHYSNMRFLLQVKYNIFHINLKTVFLNWKLDKEIYII